MVFGLAETMILGPECDVDVNREKSPIKLGDVDLSTQLLTTLHQIYIRYTKTQHKSEIDSGTGLSGCLTDLDS